MLCRYLHKRKMLEGEALQLWYKSKTYLRFVF